MAEGAIKGTAAMYEVASRYATNFAFSRFDEAEAEVAGDRPASTLALDASADDSSKYAMSEVDVHALGNHLKLQLPTLTIFSLTGQSHLRIAIAAKFKVPL